MALTYVWDFPAFDCYPDKDGYTDVVFTVHWRYNAADDAKHTAVVIGTVGVSYKEGDPFVPFEQLTPAIVTGWVEGAMGEEEVAQLQLALARQIEQQIHPSQVTLSPPWYALQTPTPTPEPTPEPAAGIAEPEE